VALFAQRVHLRDLLVERTAGQLDPERVRRDLAVLVVKTFRARILVALVAEDAVVDLAEHFADGEARIGQPEAVAAPQAPVGPEHGLGPRLIRAPHLDQIEIVEGFGKSEDHPAAVRAIVNPRGTPSLETLHLLRIER